MEINTKVYNENQWAENGRLDAQVNYQTIMISSNISSRSREVPYKIVSILMRFLLETGIQIYCMFSIRTTSNWIKGREGLWGLLVTTLRQNWDYGFFCQTKQGKGEHNGFLVNTGGVLQQILRTKLLKEQVLPDLREVEIPTIFPKVSRYITTKALQQFSPMWPLWTKGCKFKRETSFFFFLNNSLANTIYQDNRELDWMTWGLFQLCTPKQFI